MAKDAVVDLEQARDLAQNLGRGREGDEVVDALALVLDLIGEPSPAPGRMRLPDAAAFDDLRANAVDDLLLADEDLGEFLGDSLAGLANLLDRLTLNFPGCFVGYCLLRNVVDSITGGAGQWVMA